MKKDDNVAIIQHEQMILWIFWAEQACTNMLASQDLYLQRIRFPAAVYAFLAYYIGRHTIYNRESAQSLLARKNGMIYFVLFYAFHVFWSLYADLYIIFWMNHNFLGIIFALVKLFFLILIAVDLKKMPKEAKDIKPIHDSAENKILFYSRLPIYVAVCLLLLLIIDAIYINSGTELKKILGLVEIFLLALCMFTPRMKWRDNETKE